MNTRNIDLQIIDQGRNQAQSTEGRKHREALLEAIYEQSKDVYLEKLRTKLIDAIKASDMKKFFEIKTAIEAYSSTPSFRKRIARAMARVSVMEAEAYWERG